MHLFCSAATSGWGKPSGRFSLRGSFSLGRRRSSTNVGRQGLLGTAAGEDLGLKDLPDRNDVAEVLSGGANFGGAVDSGGKPSIIIFSTDEQVTRVCADQNAAAHDPSHHVALLLISLVDA